MKLGPVTNLDKRNMATQKKVGADVLSASNDVIAIFQFMANLFQFGSRNPEGIFSESNSVFVYLLTKVQGSSIILTSFRLGLILTNPSPHRKINPVKSTPRLGLNNFNLTMFSVK